MFPLLTNCNAQPKFHFLFMVHALLTLQKEHLI